MDMKSQNVNTIQSINGKYRTNSSNASFTDEIFLNLNDQYLDRGDI